MNNSLKYKRILLKLSGEVLAGSQGFGINVSIVSDIAQEIAELQKKGAEIAIVIGGGNIFRGLSSAASSFKRTSADNIGMLATLINSLTLREALVNAGAKAEVLSAIRADYAAEFYTPKKARELLGNGVITIIAGGTGNPFFTTDTAAALRCAETESCVLFKATKVDGLYDSDPMKNPDAKKITEISHIEALKRNLRVMDMTAFSFCMENNIPIVIFKLTEKGNLLKCAQGVEIGSTVH